jgi:ketosteroid isomerase-like protein
LRIARGTILLPAQVERLRDAINSHDAARVADCFTENYQCDVPMHPSRGFIGRARVRENYRAIFARVPDLRATVLRSCQDESGVWSEWEMSGTSDEGVPSVSTGVVIILSMVDGRIAHTRFYLDAVSEVSDPK